MSEEVLPGKPRKAKRTEKGVGDKSLAGRVEKSKVRGKHYVLDLKIHTPHSLLEYAAVPGIETAPALVRLALVKGLDVIALTDRNSGAFVDKLYAAALESKLTVIPGVEIRCRVGGCDDVIVSCFFPEEFTGADVQEFLRRLSIPVAAARNPRFVVPCQFESVLTLLDEIKGVALPSRVDKTPHRLSVLPILVEEFGFRAFDIAYPETSKYFATHWPKTRFSLFSFSNANALAQIGSKIAKVKMLSPGYEGVRELVKRVVPTVQPASVLVQSTEN